MFRSEKNLKEHKQCSCLSGKKIFVFQLLFLLAAFFAYAAVSLLNESEAEVAAVPFGMKILYMFFNTLLKYFIN